MGTAERQKRGWKPAGLWAAVAGALSLTANAQINDPAYADYLLVGRFGELCTMCEATVLCEAGEPVERESVPMASTFTLYHFETRTFWSQMSTIWEWFIKNVKPDALVARGHSRPVNVYTVDQGRWSGPAVREARLILDPAEIVIGDKAILRDDRRWIGLPGERDAGYCQRLPLWETLEAVQRNAGSGPAS